MTLDTQKIARAHIAVAKAHMELAALFDPTLAPPMPVEERRDLIVSLMPTSVTELRQSLPPEVRLSMIRNDVQVLLGQNRIRRTTRGRFAAVTKRR